MKQRIFIVAPVYDGDNLHVVCKTKSRDSFLNIYHTDRYEEIDRTFSMMAARSIALKHGARRVTVL